jgi:hypothetical protein
MVSGTVRARPFSSLLTALALTAPIAHAQGGDAAAAESLFREARQLMSQGKTSEACAKFEASNRLDPSSGTMINLADCHVKEGKTASAWAEFLAASRIARQQNVPQRAEEAIKRAGELEKSLSYFTLSVAGKVPGEEIRRDDALLSDGALSSKIPVDPGPHVISASAPGYKTWAKTIVVKPNGDLQGVDVPTLEKDTAAAATVPPPAASSPPTATTPAPKEKEGQEASEGSGRKTAGYVLGGIGIAATGVGTFFGLKALSTYGKVKDECPSLDGCSQRAGDLRDDAGTQGNIANITLGVGLLSLAAGAYLVFSGPSTKPSTSALSVSPTVGPSFSGATFHARY